jgi:IclR family acetate operon transcriptional repressor
LPVKRSQSASRVLAVLEKIAAHQPIGVSELARQVGADKSAVQRAIMTLADGGWIAAAPVKPTRWELTPRIHVVAHEAHGNHDLRHRSRKALESLRDETGESVLLNVPDAGRFVVIDALESRQYLRTVVPVGTIVPLRGSATARAILPYMSSDRLIELLGMQPDTALLKDFADTKARGYSISNGGVVVGSTNVAAPVFEVDGRPVAAVCISGPSDRVTASEFARLGALVSATAKRLSRGAPQAA